MACTTDITVPSPELLKELNSDLRKEWKRVLNVYYWETLNNFRKKYNIPNPKMEPTSIEYTEFI